MRVIKLGPSTWTCQPPRKSTADPQGISFLHHEGRNCPIDCGDMPADLARLVPHSWGRASLNDWQPFIGRAILHRML